MTKLYDADYYGWTRAQMDALRRRSANELDWDQLSAELDCLSACQERELESRYRALLTHLLLWIYQPEKRCRRWTNSIFIERDKLAQHLLRNPSLKSMDEETFLDAYFYARHDASTEADLDVEAFPETPPFSIDEAKSDTYWPD